MSEMPVAAGMDVMEDKGSPWPIQENAGDESADTNMREASLGGLDPPTMEDWDQGSSLSYPATVDIGTSDGSMGFGGSTGSGEAAKGTPATASAGGSGLTNMTPEPYGG